MKTELVVRRGPAQTRNVERGARNNGESLRANSALCVRATTVRRLEQQSGIQNRTKPDKTGQNRTKPDNLAAIQFTEFVTENSFGTWVSDLCRGYIMFPKTIRVRRWRSDGVRSMFVSSFFLFGRAPRDGFSAHPVHNRGIFGAQKVQFFYASPCKPNVLVHFRSEFQLAPASRRMLAQFW
jgi:hypothetical protein